MLHKPFKPPLLKPSADTVPRTDHPDAPAAKRQRVYEAPKAAQAFEPPGERKTYNVLWRRPTAKKHKTWDGDGILVVSNGFMHLKSVTGQDMGKSKCTGPIELGMALSVGGKEVEVDSLCDHVEVKPVAPFEGTQGKPTFRELEERLRTNFKFNSKPAAKPTTETEEEPQRPLQHKAVPVTSALQNQFKSPLLVNNVLPKTSVTATPRHDPASPGALVMKRPQIAPRGKTLVDVVVDPHISKVLRDHQREGVKFLYECVMGMRAGSGEGAVLADEMGLGKTLQVIALLWTLLKQSPYVEDERVIKKAMIVCPVTLIKTWRREFRKWLGSDRIGVFILDDNKKRITDFTHGRTYSVMVIGYEKLRQVQEELQKGSGVDIVICDEGHRLKTAQNKSALAIKSLKTERRVILSGTPLQNDLSEFYFMVDFVNPGLLDKPGVFKRKFETPIVKSRQPEATEHEIQIGQERSEELAELTSKFILRRTIDILSKYLPPKTENILFCRPTDTQSSVYRTIISPKHFPTVINHADTALQMINILKKLCNSPSLLKEKAGASSEQLTRSGIPTSGVSTPTEDPTAERNITSILAEVPSHLLKHPRSSGKLRVFDNLLHQIHSQTNDKVVIVSNYTSTLDLLEPLLASLSYPFVRLDGKTSTSKRQELVDRFNRSDCKSCFAFLLSAKSGGVGLNLIGANRLILFDVDWNPATDLQAMARIHRDGQKKPCHIYRLLTMGALDEKIYQRQLTKLSLAGAVVDNKVSKSTFTKDELRDLFTLDESGTCQTHELIGCECGGRGAIGQVDVSEAASEQGDAALDGDESAIDESGHGDPLSTAKYPSLVRASEVDMQAQEHAIAEMKRPKRNKMLELMQYRHFDTAHLRQLPEEGEEEAETLDDDVFFEVLKSDENRIAYVFTKTSA